MADGGAGEIVIKGGSIEIGFDGSLYLKESSDPFSHKHATRKITRVHVADEDGNSKFDSGTDEGGLRWTITVSTSEK